MFRIVCIAFLVLQMSHAMAQERFYGFRAGLNFSSILGPAEEGVDGQALETFGTDVGFHIGGGIGWAFTDRFGMRTEFLFMQRGGTYKFSGPSYWTFRPEQEAPITRFGTREMSLNISNAYIELPITGYARFVPWLEVFGGASVNFLVSSVASGDLSFQASNDGPAFDMQLGYNYYRDEALEGEQGDMPTTVTVSNREVVMPTTAGAYFEYAEKQGGLFNVVDAGLQAGLSFYFNKGLYLSGRAYYGLLDINKNEYDYSLSLLNDVLERVPRNDKDVNLSFQASIGISF